MAPPWTSSTKTISAISSSNAPVVGFSVPTKFVPPPTPTTISFSPAALAASVARAAASSVASSTLIQAISKSTEELVSAIVDNAGTDFAVDSSFFDLQDTEKTSLSSRVGAGISDLVCVSYGYIWRCLASELLTTSSKLGDYLYEGGPATGHGVVMVEAKGSIGKNTTPVHVQTRATNGFTTQVAPHLGASTSAGNVFYGYAVSSGTNPNSHTSNASIHVTEPHVPASSSGSGQDSDDQSFGLVSHKMALLNYRSVFRLCGASVIVEAINHVLDPLSVDVRWRHQRFMRIASGGRYFLQGIPERDYVSRHIRWPWSRFAIAEDVAAPLLRQIGFIFERQGRDKPDMERYLELPIMPLILNENDANLVMFRDGFAHVTIDRWSGYDGWASWHPAEGYSTKRSD